MEMSRAEMVRKYQQAKNKSQIIGIIADLNGISKDAVKEILKQEGINLNPGRPKKQKNDNAQSRKVTESADTLGVQQSESVPIKCDGGKQLLTRKGVENPPAEMPPAIQEILLEKLDQIDERILQLNQEKYRLEVQYQEIINYLGVGERRENGKEQRNSGNK